MTIWQRKEIKNIKREGYRTSEEQEKIFNEKVQAYYDICKARKILQEQVMNLFYLGIISEVE